jgi:hypothetical protein
MLPPLWECAVAAVPMLGLGFALYRWVFRDEARRLKAAGDEDLRGARVRSALASLVFTGAIGVAGWFVWWLSELENRGVVFVVLWTLISLYFVIAAGAFKTQMGRFMSGRQSFTETLRETVLNLLEALLWGPLAVRVLLRSRRP